jgi:hypothetical protein
VKKTLHKIPTIFRHRECGKNFHCRQYINEPDICSPQSTVFFFKDIPLKIGKKTY